MPSPDVDMPPLLPKGEESQAIRALGDNLTMRDETGWVCVQRDKRTMREQSQLGSYTSIIESVPLGERWVDPDPPLCEEGHPIDWRWPEEVWNPSAVTPTLFKTNSNGVHASDVVQGKCGTCWFLADVSVVSLYPALFDSITVAHDAARGVYCFRLFTEEGAERQVCVDSRVPVLRSSTKFEPAYASSVDPGELWPLLMEKALAKLCGSYREVGEGGWAARGLSAILGRVPRSYDRCLQTDGLVFSDPEALWGLFKTLRDGGFLMDATFLREETGLISQHCYGIMGIHRLQSGERLVKFRNPWGGSYEWTGAWADKSSKWDTVSDLDKQRVGYVSHSDGTFFMTIEDASKQVDVIGAARVFDGCTPPVVWNPPRDAKKRKRPEA